jgi:hypothetical protein
MGDVSHRQLMKYKSFFFKKSFILCCFLLNLGLIDGIYFIR